MDERDASLQLTAMALRTHQDNISCLHRVGHGVEEHEDEVQVDEEDDVGHAGERTPHPVGQEAVDQP